MFTRTAPSGKWGHRLATPALHLGISILFLLALPLLSACGKARTDVAEGNLAAAGNGDGDGDQEAEDDTGGTCDRPALGGADIVPSTAPSEELPVEIGGTIEGGTYDLIEVTYFEPLTACTIPERVQDTLVFEPETEASGTSREHIFYEWSIPGFPETETLAIGYEYSITGNAMTWTTVCPSAASSDQPYSVFGDEVTFMFPASDECGGSAWTFERRP